MKGCTILLFFPSVTLFVLALVFRFFSKEWVAPGAIFAIYWAIGVSVPLVFAPEGFPVEPSAVWWIVLSVICLGIGATIGGGSKKKKPEGIEEFIQYRTEKLHIPVIVFSLLGIIGVFSLLRSLGVGFGVFLSWNALTTIAASVSEARYVSGAKPPLLYTLFSSFTYAACYLGGMLWTLKKMRAAFLPFIPMALSTVITTAKAGIIFQVILWVSGWLASRVQLGITKIPVKIIFRFALAVLIMTGIFIFVSALRYRVYTIDGLTLVYEKLTVYYFGYLSGFSQWFTAQNYNLEGLGIGQYTFAGLFDVLGLSDKQQGIFNDLVGVGNYYTNIYTIFRYLIQDVGFVTSLFILFFIGLFFGWIYEKTIQGSFIATTFLMMFYAQVFFSNTTTVFGYNTMVLAWVLTALVMLYMGKKKHIKQEKSAWQGVVVAMKQ